MLLQVLLTCPGNITEIKIVTSSANILKIQKVFIKQLSGDLVSEFIYENIITIQFLNLDLTNKKIFNLHILLNDGSYYPTIKVVVYERSITRSSRFFLSQLYPYQLPPESILTFVKPNSGVLRLPFFSLEANRETFSPSLNINSGNLRVALQTYINYSVENFTTNMLIVTGGNLRALLRTQSQGIENFKTNMMTITGGNLRVALVTHNSSYENFNTNFTILGGSLETQP